MQGGAAGRRRRAAAVAGWPQTTRVSTIACLLPRGEAEEARRDLGDINEDRGALRGTPGSAYPQPEPNATELPSSAPGRPELIELQASAPSPTPTRAEEHIATTPDCRPRAPAPSPTPTRAGHLSGLQIVRLRALARRRAPKRTPHFTCRCERGTLHMKRWECLEHGRPQPRCCRCR